MANHEEKMFLYYVLLFYQPDREKPGPMEQPCVSMLVPKNLPEGPSCFEVRNRTGLVLGQLAGLRLPVRIVLWPMVTQAVVNPTMRPGVPVLCRAVSQIVGVVTSASVGETVVDVRLFRATKILKWCLYGCWSVRTIRWRTFAVMWKP